MTTGGFTFEFCAWSRLCFQNRITLSSTSRSVCETDIRRVDDSVQLLQHQQYLSHLTQHAAINAAESASLSTQQVSNTFTTCEWYDVDVTAVGSGRPPGRKRGKCPVRRNCPGA